MIAWLSKNSPFPPVEQALQNPNGLLAAGGDLSPERLLTAYRHGIFPWFGKNDPLLWWSPDPRMVLIPEQFRLSDSLSRIIRNFEVRIDSCFEQVMRGCAAPRSGQDGTWIDESMITAYCELHRLGYAHSVETWLGGNLVGGLYGVRLGRMFYGESMYSSVSNASKVALAHLCRHTDIGMIDCQMHTPHLASLGARLMPRAEFLMHLKALIQDDAAQI